MKKRFIFAALAAVFGLVFATTGSLNASQVKAKDITWNKQHTYVVKVYGKNVGGWGAGVAKVGGVSDTHGHKYYQDYDKHLFTTYNEALKSINHHNYINKFVTPGRAVSERKIVRDRHEKYFVVKVNGENVYPFGGAASTVAGWVSRSGHRYYADAHNLSGKGTNNYKVWTTVKDSQDARFPKGARWFNGKWVANK